MSSVIRGNARGNHHQAFGKILPFVCALVIALSASALHAQTYTDIYDFDCGSGNGGPGCQPVNYGQLAQGLDGNLYGTTDDEGDYILGTIFVVSPDGTSQSDLWSFDGPTGEYPNAGLTLASDGNFYGTAFNGGVFTNGTLYRFTPPSTITVLHSFGSSSTDGLAPYVPPVQAADGKLYGFSGTGTTYRLTLPTGTFQALPHNIPGGSVAPLILATDGNLYGTTYNGGAQNLGTVFRMTTAGAITILYSFSGSDGSAPSGPLVQGPAGNLLGTTSSGGANNTGTVFKLSLVGQFTTLHTFPALSGGTNSDGANPSAGLGYANNLFYGVTGQGGSLGNGTLFQITSMGAFTKLHDFDGIGFGIGAEPETTPVEHTNGSIYGLTQRGGVNTWGNVYRLSPATVIPIIRIAGPILVKPGVPVQILGNSLSHVVSLTFGAAAASFRIASDTHIVATVPQAATSGLVTATLDTGAQIQTALPVKILAVIKNFSPLSGPVGTQVTINGSGFVGTSQVTFGGVPATSFTVVSPNQISATVPAGAQTGKIVVVKPDGSASSGKKFTVT